MPLRPDRAGCDTYVDYEVQTDFGFWDDAIAAETVDVRQSKRSSKRVASELS